MHCRITVKLILSSVTLQTAQFVPSFESKATSILLYVSLKEPLSIDIKVNAIFHSFKCSFAVESNEYRILFVWECVAVNSALWDGVFDKGVLNWFVLRSNSSGYLGSYADLLISDSMTQGYILWTSFD